MSRFVKGNWKHPTLQGFQGESIAGGMTRTPEGERLGLAGGIMAVVVLQYWCRTNTRKGNCSCCCWIILVREHFTKIPWISRYWATWYNCWGGGCTWWSCPIRSVACVGDKDVFQEFHLLESFHWVCLFGRYHFWNTCPSAVILSSSSLLSLFNASTFSFVSLACTIITFINRLYKELNSMWAPTFWRAFSRLRFIASLFFALFARYSGSSYSRRRLLWWSRSRLKSFKQINKSSPCPGCFCL